MSLFVSFLAMAANFPVDEQIAGLRAKADHLEALKQIFLKNKCTITHNRNTVALTAGALRSEGLVMAIGPNFPGQYLAYSQAPKAEFLNNVIDSTFQKNGKSVGAVIVSSHLEASPGSAVLDTLMVSVNQAYQVDGTEGLWMYATRRLRTSIPKNGEHIQISGEGPSKASGMTLICN